MFWANQLTAIVFSQDGKILKNHQISEKYGKLVVTQSDLVSLGMKNCSRQPAYCHDSRGTNVTDVSVWNYMLRADEMISWTSCRCGDTNLINFVCLCTIQN